MTKKGLLGYYPLRIQTALVVRLIHNDDPAILKKIPLAAQLLKHPGICLTDHNIGLVRTGRAQSFEDCGIVSHPEIVRCCIDILGVTGNTLFDGIRPCYDLSHIDLMALHIEDLRQKCRSQTKPSAVDNKTCSNSTLECYRRRFLGRFHRFRLF